MKVDIGPYRGDIIPVRNWERSYEMFRSGSYSHEERYWTWYDKLVYKVLDKLFYVVLPINRWANQRKRKIKVHIDNYDIWSADHTLALIIHPVLLKLRENKQGSPNVALEDVPAELHPSEPAGPDNGYTDSTVHERWAYVLDEMIWAFEQCIKDDRGDDQFYHNSDQLELITSPLENGLSSIDFNYQKDPGKPKYWVDKRAKKLHYERISNGLRLFAKYYFGLWD